MNTRPLIPAISAVLVLCAGACTHHEVETHSEVDIKPIRIEPIYITVDVNLRVDRQLDDFFQFEEAIAVPEG